LHACIIVLLIESNEFDREEALLNLQLVLKLYYYVARISEFALSLEIESVYKIHRMEGGMNEGQGVKRRKINN
jgi:hypothetical protein